MNDTFQRIHDAIIRALVPARPEKAYAGSMASTMTCFAGGIRPDTGEYYIAPLYYSRLSGWGAHYCKDGKNVTTPPVGGSALRNTPMEVLERRFPLRVVQYSMRPNSGGPGEFRGGVGGTFEVIPLGHDITVTQQFQSVRCPPRGVDGGMAGRPSASVISAGQREVRRLPPMLSGFTVGDGQSYRLMYSGGGGWGDPFKREPQRVLNDVIQGLVGVREASMDYGVIIDPERLLVDEAATTACRADPSNRREPAPWPLLEV
jgi:N-methylhydantoinase B